MKPERIGAVSYVLWGILHIVVGIIPLVLFFTGSSMFYSHVVSPSIEHGLVANLIAQHYFNLIAVGIMAILVASLNWKNDTLGFWINAVVLGLVDISFIAGELVPGHLPLEAGIIGPVLYLIGLVGTGYGLYKS